MITAEEARGLLEMATPGPWRADDEHGLIPGACPVWVVSQTNEAGDFLGDLAYIPQSGTDTRAGPQEQPDAELMAAAPDLAAAVVALAEQLDAARRDCERTRLYLTDERIALLDAQGELGRVAIK